MSRRSNWSPSATQSASSGRLEQALELGLARLEPRPLVVRREVHEELDGVGREALERGRRGGGRGRSHVPFSVARSLPDHRRLRPTMVVRCPCIGAHRALIRLLRCTRPVASAHGHRHRPPGDAHLAAARRRVRDRRDRLRRAVHVPGPVGRVRPRLRHQPVAGGHAVDDVPHRHGDLEPAPRPGVRRVRRSRPAHGGDGPQRRRLARGLPGARHLDRDPRLRGAPRDGPPARVHRHDDGHRPALRRHLRAGPRADVRRTGRRGRDRAAARGRDHRVRRLAGDRARVPRRVASWVSRSCTS